MIRVELKNLETFARLVTPNEVGCLKCVDLGTKRRHAQPGDWVLICEDSLIVVSPERLLTYYRPQGKRAKLIWDLLLSTA